VEDNVPQFLNIHLQQIYIIRFVMFPQSIAEVDIALRECPKCHRQNQPTRKYCTRCGASLIQVADEQPATPEPVVPETPKVIETPSSEPAPAVDEPLVRPSKVATDRVIPPERHVEKTELEKAQEAFAKAEGVGIEEATGDGIVETRMLRASEVRELMDNAASWAETQPAQPSGVMESPEEPASSPMPTSADIEKGILGSKSEFVDKPKPVPEPSPSQLEVSTPPTSTGPPGAPAAAPPTASAPPPVSTPAPAPKPAATKTVESPPDVKGEMWDYESKIPDKEFLDDFNIKGILSDLKHSLMELKQAEADLSSCSTRHDETVTQYRNAAEVKRMNYESLQEQAKHAKEEWNDAEKEYRLADDRRKKETSSRQKRVEKIQKQIKKSESMMNKRVKELNKEKEKRAKEEAKRT
jgi:hypothetical protein